ncbi:MAG: DUF4386 domain-containing protein [Flavobacteriales bacterium]|nr:DUF4386 domain-containing protein [Flavobacteriales bacterium]
MRSSQSLRKSAVLSGISILIMAIVALVIMPTIFKPIFDADKGELRDVFTDVKPFFLSGVLGWVIILATDVMVSWGLYRYYKTDSNLKSELMGGLRLLYSVGLGIGVVQLVRAYLLLKSSEYSVMEVYNLVISFQSIWQLSLIVFGVHLLVLSALVCRKKTFRQAISLLLFVAGVGYTISNTANLLIADYDELYREKIEIIFILPMLLGEVLLAFWLLWRGAKSDRIVNQEKLIVS